MNAHTPLPYTDEQIAILDAARTSSANLMIEAYAGCGKTKTLEALGRESISKRTPILYLVFNKKNAIEASSVMPDNCFVATFNSFGHRAWAAKIYTKLILDKDKTRTVYKSMIDDSPKLAQGEMWAVYSAVIDGVNRAKNFGYIPEGVPRGTSLISRSLFHNLLDEAPDDFTADLIDSVLTRSIQLAFKGTIDFNDQVYMPALFGGSFTKYPVVLVDEYQDLSPVNHRLLELIVTARIIGVGDRFQNIYGFRGAKAGGMLEAVAHYGMSIMPLSLTFRCPSEIVSHVRWRVPNFRAAKLGGSVSLPTSLSSTDITDSHTIICRNNAPLFSAAIKLLSTGHSISIVGSDIATRLLTTMRKLGPGELTRKQTIYRIQEWLAEKLAAESKSAQDLADCMMIFAEHGSDLAQAIAYAEHVLKASGPTILTTGHKAKGLEYPNVIHLDPYLLRKHPDEQNQNLDYVISTRSSSTLLEIASEQIKWE